MLGACTPQVSESGGLSGNGVSLEPRFSGLTQPTDVRFLPGGSGRALVSEQADTVKLVGAGKNKTVLELRGQVGCCGERGF